MTLESPFALIASRNALAIAKYLVLLAMLTINVHGQTKTTNSQTHSLEKRNDKLSEELEKLAEQHQLLVSKKTDLEDRVSKQRAEQQELLAKKAVIDKWRHTSFVLLSNRTAVGISADRSSEFKLETVAHFPDSEYVAKIAQHFSIPSIVQDDRLTESLGMSLIGTSIPKDLAKSLSKYWCTHKYVPVGKHDDGKLVVFRDMETNNSRVGFLVSTKANALEFQPVGSRPETIARNRIQSGTARTGSALRLASEPEVDLLDLCALRIAQKMECDENVPSFQAVAVHVKVDDLEEAMKLSKQLDETWNDRYFDFLARSTNTIFTPDQRKEPTRVLRRFRDVVEDEMRSRLGRLGLPLVEREELDTVIGERELAETKHFDQRRYTKLTSASHAVLVEVGKPTNGGVFRVDVRLTDVGSGNILFEDTGDLGRPVATIASNYFVQSGELALLSPIDASTNVTGRKQKPLRLTSFHGAPADGRLVLFEKANASNISYFDLFDDARQVASREGAKLSRVSSFDTIPRDEKLRWLTWQILKSSLPTAGKVQSVGAESVVFNIGSNHGVRKGDQFQLIRQATDSNNRTRIVLPFELKADVVGPNQTSGYLAESDLSQLWDDFELQEGDLVVRQGAPDCAILVAPPVANPQLWQGDVAKKLNTWNRLQMSRILQKMSSVSNSLAESMAIGIQQNGVPTPKEWSGNATHTIQGFISPLEANVDCHQFLLNLEIRNTGTGDLIQSIGNIKFHEDEIRGWRP